MFEKRAQGLENNLFLSTFTAFGHPLQPPQDPLSCLIVFLFAFPTDFVSSRNLGLMPLDIVVLLPTFVPYLTGPLPLIVAYLLIVWLHPGNAILSTLPHTSGIAQGSDNRTTRAAPKCTAMSRRNAHGLSAAATLTNGLSRSSPGNNQ